MSADRPRQIVSALMLIFVALAGLAAAPAAAQDQPPPAAGFRLEPEAPARPAGVQGPADGILPPRPLGQPLPAPGASARPGPPIAAPPPPERPAGIQPTAETTRQPAGQPGPRPAVPASRPRPDSAADPGGVRPSGPVMPPPPPADVAADAAADTMGVPSIEPLPPRMLEINSAPELAGAPAGGVPWWLAAGGVLLLGLLLAGLRGRRRRAAAGGPIIAAAPAAAAPQPPLDLGNFAPPAPAPPVPVASPAGLVTTRMPRAASPPPQRAAVAASLGISAVRLTAEQLEFAFELELANRGAVAAEGILVRLLLAQTSAGQQAAMEAFFDGLRGQVLADGMALVPGEVQQLTGQLSLARANAPPLPVGGHPVLIPVLAVDVSYHWDGMGDGFGQDARTYVIGQPGAGGPGRVMPIRLDLLPRALPGAIAAATGLMRHN